ncbi:uncharacterized protein LOC116954077 [Petromyzon marinus]|uniref:uncharacterized protein LOC116954077 n=1 Tax=Petromyzon marinus TaxID=7757 RepID=UPI003F70DBBF
MEAEPGSLLVGTLIDLDPVDSGVPGVSEVTGVSSGDLLSLPTAGGPAIDLLCGSPRVESLALPGGEPLPPSLDLLSGSPRDPGGPIPSGGDPWGPAGDAWGSSAEGTTVADPWGPAKGPWGDQAEASTVEGFGPQEGGDAWVLSETPSKGVPEGVSEGVGGHQKRGAGEESPTASEATESADSSEAEGDEEGAGPGLGPRDEEQQQQQRGDGEDAGDGPEEERPLVGSGSAGSLGAPEGGDEGTPTGGRTFVRNLAAKIVDQTEEVSEEERAAFAEALSGEGGKGRDWFARYIVAQGGPRCVSALVFSKLTEAFSALLTECHRHDDFLPAARILPLCFEFHCLGDVTLGRGPSGERRDPGEGSLDSYFRSANSWLADKKGKAGRLLRAAPLAPPNIRGLLGGFRTPFGRRAETPVPSSPPDEGTEENPEGAPGGDAEEEGGVSAEAAGATEEQATDSEVRGSAEGGGVAGEEGEAVTPRTFLYTHLKDQPIWQTLRFWNAALFQALHVERQKHELPHSGSQRKELCTAVDSSREVTESITFNLLGCLSGRMLSLGLSRRACAEFLRRQCDTGGLAEEQLEALVANMERLESAAAAAAE